ncbi:MAG TPA: hypothetical protein PK059_02040 [Cyclobacteriaceae bacterium]|nr:hypothetical protein [Cyclobacteriaceae bacterium]
MALYRFKEKGPAYGLGHTEGELIEYDDNQKISAMCLVPVVDREGRQVGGKQVIAKKEYTVGYLVDNGVISLVTDAKVREEYKKGNHINARADKLAKETKELEAAQLQARKDIMK